MDNKGIKSHEHCCVKSRYGILENLVHDARFIVHESYAHYFSLGFMYNKQQQQQQQTNTKGLSIRRGMRQGHTKKERYWCNYKMLIPLPVIAVSLWNTNKHYCFQNHHPCTPTPTTPNQA